MKTESRLQIFNQTRQTLIASHVYFADTFFTRMSGLLTYQKLEVNQALIITRCKSIHMLFMRFAIDAIFMGKDNRVVGLVEKIKPFQLSPIFFKSSYVIELPIGVIGQTQTMIGDQLELKGV